MAENLVSRFALQRLELLVGAFRIVIVNGPRQSGKTTLLAMLRDQRGGTLRSLDNADALAAAAADPREFARRGERPIIVDEVQRGGDPLILEIKNCVDEDNSPGHFVLAGSTRFLTIPTLSESLAGRAVFVDLWPLSVAERAGVAGGGMPEILFDSPRTLLDSAASTWTREDYLRLITEGGFPEAIRLPAMLRGTWFDGYLNTVIQRDIRQFADIRHGSVLPQLLRLLAARAGSPVVTTDLARAVDLNVTTVRDYLSYLTMVFLTIPVPAWSTSATTKATRTPKTFLTDVGVAAHLLGVNAAALLEPGHKATGALLETFVITELVKLCSTQDQGLTVQYFRDRDGREVDVILEARDGRVVALEVKASSSASPRDFRHLIWLREKLGDRFIAGLVCNLGTESLSFGDRLMAVPVSSLWQHAPLW